MAQIFFTSDSNDRIDEPSIAKAFAEANESRQRMDLETVGIDRLWKLFNELLEPRGIVGNGVFLPLGERAEIVVRQVVLADTTGSDNGTYAYFADPERLPGIADWLNSAVLSASIDLLNQ